MADLTEAQQNEVRRLWQEGRSQPWIAARYGVTRHTIAKYTEPRRGVRVDTAGMVSNAKALDEAYARFKAEEKQLPPDTRGRWEQWMPRPGRSALDQKRAQGEM